MSFFFLKHRCLFKNSNYPSHWLLVKHINELLSNRPSLHCHTDFFSLPLCLYAQTAAALPLPSICCHVFVKIAISPHFHLVSPVITFPVTSSFYCLLFFFSPLFISAPSSSPSPHCRCHCRFQEQVGPHSAPLRFCLSDLTSNADRPRTPPAASLVPELLHPPISSFPLYTPLPFPLPFSRVCFHLLFACLAPPLSISPFSPPSSPPLHNPRVFPRAPTWSPW